MPYTMNGRNSMLNLLKGPVVGATGQNTGDTITKTAHGLANGEIVTFIRLTGGTGLTLNQAYHVVNQAANTFQVALTPGGSAEAITADYTDVEFIVGALITHVGLFDDGTGVTLSTSADADDIVDATAHGFSAGDLVFFSGLTGGSNVVAGRPYFVISANLAANTFQVSTKPGGSAINFGSDITAGTVTRAVELSGGSPAYARKSISYAYAADGQLDDTNNGIDIDVPSGATVNRVGYWSALTGGVLIMVTTQTAEGPYGAQGIYRVTDSKQHLNATGAS